MIQLGTNVVHIASQKKCFVIYINDKEPKYRVRFPDMYAMDVYTTELEELEKEEPLLASEPVVGEILIGAESMQVRNKVGAKEEMSSKEEIKINKDVKK